MRRCDGGAHTLVHPLSALQPASLLDLISMRGNKASSYHISHGGILHNNSHTCRCIMFVHMYIMQHIISVITVAVASNLRGALIWRLVCAPSAWGFPDWSADQTPPELQQVHMSRFVSFTFRNAEKWISIRHKTMIKGFEDVSAPHLNLQRSLQKPLKPGK